MTAALSSVEVDYSGRRALGPVDLNDIVTRTDLLAIVPTYVGLLLPGAAPEIAEQLRIVDGTIWCRPPASASTSPPARS